MSTKFSITSLLITALAVTTLGVTGTLHAADTLPFTVTLEEISYTDNPPPKLQSFTSAVLEDGRWLIMAGRVVGLHTFNAVDNQANPSQGNFPPTSANWKMYVIDPNEGVQASFDVSQLSNELSSPLRSTNQQFWHDEENDTLYVTGGYGVDYADDVMVTFDTLLVMSPEKVASILTSGDSSNAIAKALEAEIQVFHDNRFAVTGGYFENLDGLYYLAFGQLFFGQYSTFGRPHDSLFAQRQQSLILEKMETTGHDVAELRTATTSRVPFVQHYTEELRVFTLDPDEFNILSYGATVTSDAARSFHRRDGNFVKTVDPATGKARLAAFGGVFPPGVIGAYAQPIYIDGPGIYDIADFEQSFSQYECPILVLYDPESKVVYHTFFGGISGHFYHLTKEQMEVYEKVTEEGRNDGLPFINDISVLALAGDGTHTEYILPEAFPDFRLLGANAELLPAVTPKGSASIRYESAPEVVDLSKMKPGQSRVVGYVYGGIEAEAPLPKIPNSGTKASRSVFAVTVTKTPSNVIPASKAKFANPDPHFHRARGAMLSHGED